jgi:DNA-binding response OmpR family regulator
MDIACMTDNDYLRARVERALETHSERFTGYRSVASLARGLDRHTHDVLLLAGECDLIEKFVACRLPLGSGVRPMVILLSEHECGDAIDRALAAGFDDFVSIASGLGQLATRIRAYQRRRSSPITRDVLAAGGVALDRRDRSARLHGLQVDLTQREFSLAWALFESLGGVVTVRHLAETLWGQPAEAVKRSIEQHVYRLRGKLRLTNECALSLTTIYGRGYRLDATGTLRPTLDSPAAADIGGKLAFHHDRLERASEFRP